MYVHFNQWSDLKIKTRSSSFGAHPQPVFFWIKTGILPPMQPHCGDKIRVIFITPYYLTYNEYTVETAGYL